MTRSLIRGGPAAACALAFAAGLAAPPDAAQARGKLGDRLRRTGSHGRDVRQLQRSLTRLGHPTGVDGRLRLEPGTFEVLVGTSAADLPLRDRFDLTGEVIVPFVRTTYFAAVDVS